MNKSLRTRFFIRFGLAAKELCERKKSHKSENKRKNKKKNKRDLSPDRQSAPGLQASVLILLLAHSVECIGAGNCPMSPAELQMLCSDGDVRMETD